MKIKHESVGSTKMNVGEGQVIEFVDGEATITQAQWDETFSQIPGFEVVATEAAAPKPKKVKQPALDAAAEDANQSEG